jgi:hypothetical protein
MLSTKETPAENKLDFLQRQSWQLELIITGFALAGMISGADKFYDLILQLRDTSLQFDYIGPAASFILWGINLAYFVTILHFFMNVVLRCLWIGGLALRGVMNKDTYLNDDYAPNFANYLTRRHGNFDRYIERLDKAASLVFAFTFLLIAILFGLISYLLVYMGFFSLMTAIFGAIGAGIASALFLVYLLAGLLYLADFLTSGAFKRGGEAFYFPIYRVMGWLTFARLYRPLYYAIISNKWGKRLLLAMVPYLLLLIFLPQQTLNPIPYVDRVSFISSGKTKSVHKDRFYADAEGFRPTAVPVFIDSDLITDKALRVHLPLQEYYAEEIALMAEQEQATTDTTGDLYALPDTEVILSPQDSMAQAARKKKERKEKLEANSRKTGENIGRWVSGRLPFSTLPSNSDSLLIARFFNIMELRLDGKMVDPANVLLSVSYTGSPVPELIAYFPLREIAPGMHRLEFKVFGVATKGENKGNIDLRDTFWIPFFYAPE